MAGLYSLWTTTSPVVAICDHHLAPHLDGDTLQGLSGVLRWDDDPPGVYSLPEVPDGECVYCTGEWPS